MEKTFNDSLPTGAQRDETNQQRAQQGEPQLPHAAGREQVADKDPKQYDVRGGPGSQGNQPVQDPKI